MKMADLDCGCSNRKYIMFQAGQLGFIEAAILASAVGLLLIAKVVRHA